jgi:hypothetical protein
MCIEERRQGNPRVPAGLSGFMSLLGVNLHDGGRMLGIYSHLLNVGLVCLVLPNSKPYTAGRLSNPLALLRLRELRLCGDL